MNTRRYSTILLCSLFLFLAWAPPALAQTSRDENPPGMDLERLRRAQTSFRFLSTSVSARAAGMAGAVTALENGVMSQFYNPATMSTMQGTAGAAFGQIDFIADIKYNFAGLAYIPAGGTYGVFGLTLMAVDYGEFIGTRVADNDAGFVDTESFSPSALAVGLGYARTVSDRFAVGANVKYARQRLGPSVVSDVGTESQGAIAIDFGVRYLTGFRSLSFAAVAKNFAREVTYAEESFELPLALNIGLAMDVIDLTNVNPDMHSFVVSVDAERPRDFYEHLRIGGEYTFMNVFSVRGGYLFPSDELGLSAGAGLNLGVGGLAFGADYAYTDFGRLGTVNRIMISIGL
jgi:hypothetical protein